MATRLLLFGAGASFGSVNAFPSLPPLGKDLYDDLRKVYPKAWGILPDDKRASFVPNFEPGMKELWDSSWHGTADLMRCLGDYFARFRLKDENTYTRLIEHLQFHGAIEGTTFSSLNYDCLLEYGIRTRRLEMCYDSPDPSTSKKASVLKIHGSCNFLPGNIAALPGTVSYSAKDIGWDGNVMVVDPSQVGRYISQSAFYPAMAVFMEGKPVRSHGAAIAEMQKWWKDAVLKAKKIGIVGVNPNPADTHIWEPLAACDAELIIVGDERGYEAWHQQSRPSKKMEVVGSRFDPSVVKFAEKFSA
jgi:hypothetical protein